VVLTRHGVTAVFLDPPYTEGDIQYSAGGCGGEIAAAVSRWATQHADHPNLRIALCGYDGEHEMSGWTCVRWKPRKGYQSTDSAIEDRGRERIWFSPHCLKPPSLFDVESEIAPHSDEWMRRLGARDEIAEEAFGGDDAA
jgi:hypothetical protein